MERAIKDVLESVEQKRAESKYKLDKLRDLCACCRSSADEVDPEKTKKKIDETLNSKKSGKKDKELHQYPEVFTPEDEDAGRDRPTDAQAYLGRNTTDPKENNIIDPIKIAKDARAELESKIKSDVISKSQKKAKERGSKSEKSGKTDKSEKTDKPSGVEDGSGSGKSSEKDQESEAKTKPDTGDEKSGTGAASRMDDTFGVEKDSDERSAKRGKDSVAEKAAGMEKAFDRASGADKGTESEKGSKKEKDKKENDNVASKKETFYQIPDIDESEEEGGS